MNMWRRTKLSWCGEDSETLETPGCLVLFGDLGMNAPPRVSPSSYPGAWKRFSLILRSHWPPYHTDSRLFHSAPCHWRNSCTPQAFTNASPLSSASLPSRAMPVYCCTTWILFFFCRTNVSWSYSSFYSVENILSTSPSQLACYCIAWLDPLALSVGHPSSSWVQEWRPSRFSRLERHLSSGSTFCQPGAARESQAQVCVHTRAVRRRLIIKICGRWKGFQWTKRDRKPWNIKGSYDEYGTCLVCSR